MKRFLPFIFILSACGPGLPEQQSLVRRVKAAVSDCKKTPAHCKAAEACAKRAQVAQKAIQSLQEARSKGQADPDLAADAAGAYAAADSACGVWR